MSRKPEDSPWVAWIDLETTGNKDDDSIIEVGFVLTDRDLNEEFADSWVIRPWDWPFLRKRMEPVVVDMHTKNGLIDALDMFGWGSFGSSRVDAELADVLKHYGKGNHIPLAGSGVSHFDRRYIKREMPKSNDLLGHWHYDIGTMRRWLKWWDIPTPGSEKSLVKTHRALDDIREHIAETRIIRDVLQRHAEDSWKYWELNR